MANIKITGWNAGFRKNQMIVFLMEEFKIPLHDAHNAVEKILSKKSFNIEVSDENLLETVEKINSIGAVTAIEK